MTTARTLVPAVLVAALGAAAGCRTPEFEPVRGPETSLEYAGTYYELSLDGTQLGDAKVWTRGVRPVEGAEEGPPWRIHMGIRLRNDGQAPLRLDLEGCELEVQTEGEDGELFVVSEEGQVDGELEVPGEAIRRIALHYDLPAAVGDVDEILGLELSWAVATPEGRITESTPFRRERRTDRDDYYYRPWTYDNTWGVGPYNQPFFPYD